MQRPLPMRSFQDLSDAIRAKFLALVTAMHLQHKKTFSTWEFTNLIPDLCSKYRIKKYRPFIKSLLILRRESRLTPKTAQLAQKTRVDRLTPKTAQLAQKTSADTLESLVRNLSVAKLTRVMNSTDYDVDVGCCGNK